VNVYLLRHGQTAYNRDGLGLGRADVPLTEVGLRQADAAAGALAGAGSERVLTSPLARARELAERIAARAGIAVEQRDELIELDIGVTEGLTFTAMREQFPDFLRAWAGPEAAAHTMPGGEALADVDARLARLVDELERGTGDAIAVVSHNFVLRLLVCRLLGLGAGSFRSFAFDLASISEVRYERGAWVVHRLNETCHLRQLES